MGWSGGGVVTVASKALSRDVAVNMALFRQPDCFGTLAASASVPSLKDSFTSRKDRLMRTQTRFLSRRAFPRERVRECTFAQ